MRSDWWHFASRQVAEEAAQKLHAAQQAEERASEKLALQKSALSALEADFEARTQRLQAALQEAAAAKSSVDALHAEASKAGSEAAAAQKVTITLRIIILKQDCIGPALLNSPRVHWHEGPTLQTKA